MAFEDIANVDPMVSCKFDESAFAIVPSSTTGDAVISADQLMVLVDASRPNSLPAPLFEMATAMEMGKFRSIFPGLQVNPSCL